MRPLTLHPAVPPDSSRLPKLVPLAATQLFGIGCGVLGVRWTSAVIPPELLGLYGLLLSAVQAAIAVTHQGLSKHVQRDWHRAMPGRRFVRQLAAAALHPLYWLAAGLAVVLWIVHATGGVPLHPAAYAWLLAANLGAATAVILTDALQSEERYWATFTASAVGSLTRSFGPPLAVMAIGATLPVVCGAFLVHQLTVIVLMLWMLRGAWHRPDTGSAHDAGAKLAPMVRMLAFSGGCAWIAAAAPRWIAALVLDEAQTGFFVLAGNLSLIVPAAAGSVLLNFTFPTLFARARGGAGTADLARSTHITVAIMMVLSQTGLCALDLLTPVLIGPVIDERYAPATDWILATGGAALATAPALFYQNLLLARGHDRDCVKLNAGLMLMRLGLMLGGATVGEHAFRASLVAMPWFTALLAAAGTRWLLRLDARSP